MKEIIENKIRESIYVKEKILASRDILNSISVATSYMMDSLRNNGKILLCGNGGSASDALHIASELVGRFQINRAAIPAIAINSDVSTMTSIANDYGYDRVFERIVDGLMQNNDILLGISTSGNSENVCLALEKAKEKNGIAIALLGKDGGKAQSIADVSIIVPSSVTARIQEAHIMIGHIMCEIIEGTLNGK